MAENNIVNIDKRCKLGDRRVPNGTHGGLRGRMPGIMGILLLDCALQAHVLKGLKFPSPPDSGKDIAEHQGCPS